MSGQAQITSFFSFVSGESKKKKKEDPIQKPHTKHHAAGSSSSASGSSLGFATPSATTRTSSSDEKQQSTALSSSSHAVEVDGAGSGSSGFTPSVRNRSASEHKAESGLVRKKLLTPDSESDEESDRVLKKRKAESKDDSEVKGKSAAEEPTPKTEAKPKRKRVVVDSEEESESDYEPSDSAEEDESEESDEPSDSEDDYSAPKQRKKAKAKSQSQRKKPKHAVAAQAEEEDEDSVMSAPLPQPAAGSSDVKEYVYSSEGEAAAAAAAATASSAQASVPVDPLIAKHKRALLGMSSEVDDGGPGAEEAAGHGGVSVPPSFAQEGKQKDKNGLRPDQPGYDPRTLRVPAEARSKLSPAQQQYWDIKSEHNDVVLFFKVGKFYELFNNDAYIGVKELNLQFMTHSSIPHAGFPEAAFAKYAQTLVNLGYKVGRVEQVETPEQMKEHNLNVQGKNKRKVVRRDMVQMLTPGTLVDPGMIDGAEAGYTLAVREEESSNSIGVCFVDASTGMFHVGQFADDRQRTRLRTLLAQIKPKELVYPRDSTSKLTLSVLKNNCSHVPKQGWNGLNDGTEFWDAATATTELDSYGVDNNPYEWPAELEKCRNKPLALSALGGCIWYLRRALLDEELVSMRKFELYDPGSPQTQAKYMTLDGQTLSNLEILENENGKSEGTLLKFLDRCVSPFGKRLLKNWVTFPLGRPEDINKRLDAVEGLMQHTELCDLLSDTLKGLPDLERMLSRIHAMGLGRDKDAVMYTDVNKVKLRNFVRVLTGFKTVTQGMKRLCKAAEAAEFKAPELVRLLTYGHAGGYPDLDALLKQFEDAFDHKEAQELGYIMPLTGVDEEYDAVVNAIGDIERELKQQLSGHRRLLGTDIKYVHKNKERYQMELSASVKNIPSDWQLMSQTKKVKRYWSRSIREKVQQLDELEFNKDTVQRDVTRRMFVRFSKHNAMWDRAVKCLSQLDCLRSLALVSAYGASDMCRPEFVESTGVASKPMLELRGAAHPCVATLMDDNFVPNDTVIGCEENKPRFVLVSGPNMGGKSTLLRQTCVAVIMAQIGCFVPATKCKLRAVDRIFTRVGANDRIMQGQSTFLVELEETANILRHATDRSLVILDELGRGTSTFDGTAIAHAVIQYLAQQVGCLTLFSTHYHMLLEDFSQNPLISMYHMSCVVDNEKEDVTFLYRFAPGICPKSYGMNVARLAGLPETVVVRAKHMSETFEARLEAAHSAHKSDDASTGMGSTVMMTPELQRELLLHVQSALENKEESRVLALRQQARDKAAAGLLSQNSV